MKTLHDPPLFLSASGRLWGPDVMTTALGGGMMEVDPDRNRHRIPASPRDSYPTGHHRGSAPLQSGSAATLGAPQAPIDPSPRAPPASSQDGRLIVPLRLGAACGPSFSRDASARCFRGELVREGSTSACSPFIRVLESISVSHTSPVPKADFILTRRVSTKRTNGRFVLLEASSYIRAVEDYYIKSESYCSALSG